MQACVVGGGLAGALLAWRLAQASTRWHVDLVAGRPGRIDATAASGGAVRSFEPQPQQRRLATASMVELLASETLRHWAEYRCVESVYLRREPDGLDEAAADIEHLLPGSVRLAAPAELERDGWAPPHPDGAAIRERHAGYISPGRLRESVLADGSARWRVSVRHTAIDAITPRPNGLVECAAGGERREYDVVVLAAGAWTAQTLRANGLAPEGYRVKSIQYGIYPTGDWRPPTFVDEVTGLYGRPVADAELLLGLPTEHWDVDPDRPPTTPALHDRAVRLAQALFPKLHLGPATRLVGSADCYCDRPVLSLRPVGDHDHQLFTFSGGAGGAGKTALAASHRAAIQLTELGQPN